MGRIRLEMAGNIGKPAQIDRENGVIRGVTAMMANVEALGHHANIDNKTVRMMLDLYNADGKPRRQRFGHPGISENDAGRLISKATNFRIVNGNLVHDSTFIKAAAKSPVFAKDPIDYIFTMAETSPTEFSESVVISTNYVWIMPDGSEIPANDHDEDMPEIRPPGAISEYPFMRPTQFHYVDWVSEGAATHDGIFNQKFFKSGGSAFAEELFDLVDKFRETYNVPLSAIPKKTNQLLAAYIAARKGKQSMSKSIVNPLEEGDIDFTEQQESLAVPTPDSVDNALTEMQDRAAALVANLQQPVVAKVESMDAEELSALSELHERIANLEELNTKLSARFDQVYATQADLLIALEGLRMNQEILSGQPNVKESVPTTAMAALTKPASAFRHVRPASLSAVGKPVSMMERGPLANGASALSADATPLERSIYIQRQRTALMNAGGSQNN